MTAKIKENSRKVWTWENEFGEFSAVMENGILASVTMIKRGNSLNSNIFKIENKGEDIGDGNDIKFFKAVVSSCVELLEYIEKTRENNQTKISTTPPSITISDENNEWNKIALEKAEKDRSLLER